MSGKVGKSGKMKRLLRPFAWVLGVLLLLIVAVQVVLQSGLPAKIARRIAPEYLDADLSLGSLKLSLIGFPTVSMSAEDLCICYPHDRFSCFDGTGMYETGRSSECDTLACLGSLDLKLRISGLGRGVYRVPKVSVSDLRVYARQYDSTTVNWDVLRLPQRQKDTVSGALHIIVRDMEICDSTRFLFASVPMEVDSICIPVAVHSGFRLLKDDGVLSASVKDLRCNIAHIPLTADAKLAVYDTLRQINGRLEMDGCPLGTVINSYGTLFVPQAAYLETDARLSLSASADGSFGKVDGKFVLPDMKVKLAVPDAALEYAHLVEDGRFDLEAEMENSGRMVVHVPDFCFHVDGLDVNVRADAEDVTGNDPVVSAVADASLVLEKLTRFLPKSLGDMKASGRLDVDISGAGVHARHLDLKSLGETDLDATLVGNKLTASLPSKVFSAYLDNPKVRVQTMESMVVPGKSAFGVKVDVDSASVAAKDKYIKGKNLQLFIQNSLKQIDTASKLSPMVGKIKADRFAMRGADSLVVGLSKTDNTFSVVPSGRSGNSPKLQFESENGMVFFRNVGNKVVANGLELSATARMEEGDEQGVRRRSGLSDSLRTSKSPVLRKFKAAKRDTSLIPDYLQEKDFYASDISVSLDKQLKEKLRLWNPSGRVKVSKAVYMTPSFPLRNRITCLDGSFSLNEIDIDSLGITSGTSDLYAEGKLSGLRQTLVGNGKGMMKLDLDLKSGVLNLSEIFSAVETGKEIREMANGKTVDSDSYLEDVILDTLGEDSYKPLSARLLVMPANLNADVDLSVGCLRASRIATDSVVVNFDMKERCARFSDLKAITPYGKCLIDAFYSTKTKQDISFGVGVNLSEVTAGDIISTFPVIDSLVPLLKTFKGMLNVDVAATSQLDTNMNFILPSMSGVARISGKNLVLQDVGKLKKTTRMLMFKNPDAVSVDSMSVSAVLADNQLEVFPFIVNIDRYTLAVNGLQRFGNGFDAHLSIIKSPLLFKFGVNAFGPNFKQIKYRLGRPKFQTTAIPVFNEEIDGIKINLVSTIKNIYSKGVTQVMKQHKEATRLAGDLGKTIFNPGEMEDLPANERYKLEEMMIAAEINEETRSLNEELDRLLAEF